MSSGTTGAPAPGPITTHVLDLATGRPAAGIAIVLERQDGAGWRRLAQGQTDADGRLKGMLPAGRAEPGHYRLSFDVGAYFAAAQRASFYTSVPIEFQVTDAAEHYHVPLLVSPFGYSTYRGS